MIRFVRPDLLYAGETTCPETREVAVLPIDTGTILCGPTICDVIATREDRFQLPDGRRLKQTYWRRRNPDTIWVSAVEQEQRRRMREVAAISGLQVAAGKRVLIPDHPFLEALASGGTFDKSVPSPEEFVRVTKTSTVQVPKITFLLAQCLCGDYRSAYVYIAQKAIKYWEDDLTRSLTIWAMLPSEGEILETPEITWLRPPSSMAAHVEGEILREFCAWNGVDPDAVIHRPKGRPKGTPGTEGEVIAMSIDEAGVVSGRFKVEFEGVRVMVGVACRQPGLHVGAAAHFRGAADQHRYAPFAALMEKPGLPLVGVGLVDVTDHASGHARRDQPVAHGIVGIPPVGTRCAGIAEDQLE